MKNKRPLILLLLVCCLATQAFGQATFGGRDCGQWITRKKDQYTELAITGWLVGFMSGLNSMYWLKTNKVDPLNKVNSADQIYLWVDNYCQKNPLSNLSVGGAELLLELIKKP